MSDKKINPRWDIGAVGSKPKPLFYLSDEDIASVLSKDLSPEILGNLRKSLNIVIDAHVINKATLDNRNIPTSAEYRETFRDLINSINDMGEKLTALSNDPFIGHIQNHLEGDIPENNVSKFITDTRNKLDLIQLAACQALDNIKVSSGNRKKEYDIKSFMLNIAKCYEKRTGREPTGHCKDIHMGEIGEFANIVLLCYQRTNDQVSTDFCNQIKAAIREYRI